jgi:hypothetical protein
VISTHEILGGGLRDARIKPIYMITQRCAGVTNVRVGRDGGFRVPIAVHSHRGKGFYIFGICKGGGEADKSASSHIKRIKSTNRSFIFYNRKRGLREHRRRRDRQRATGLRHKRRSRGT